MTKQVRIENADTTPYKVVVETWDRAYPPGSGPDTLASTTVLDYPTAMTPPGMCITSTRYLIVKEA
jgi:hypothetical protein